VKTLARSWDRIAERLHAQAEAIGQQMEQLAEPVWSGLAAEMFRTQLKTVADGFSRGATKHAEAAQVCTRWAADLRSAQSAADAALEEAIEAQAEIEAQEAALTALSGGLVSAEAALAGLRKTSAQWSGVTPPNGVTVPTAAEVTAAQKRLAKVEADLAVCRRRLDAAEQRLSAARAAAQQAEEAFHQNERLFVDGVEAAMTGAPDWPTQGAQAFSPGMTAVAALDAAGDTLGALGRLTPEQWAALIAQKPELVWQLLGNPPEPDKVAAWCNKIKDTPTAKGLIAKAPWLLGDLDGMPFTVRDTCNREMLKRALKDPAAVYKTLDPRHRPTPAEFVKQVTALADALKNADGYARRLPGDPANQVAQLVVFGVFKNAVAGGISLGNLDTATNVTVNVPGAQSNIADTMNGYLRGDLDLINAAYKKNRHDSYAMVTWVGYHAPEGWQAGIGDNARDGAKPLADFLDGIQAGRPGNPPRHTTVTGHSYGSTTVAEALRQVRYAVDDFISYGSVGFEKDTRVDDLNVKNVYATEAAKDDTADWGRGFTLGNRTDPRELPGVSVFPSDGVPGLKDVGGHHFFPTMEDPTDPEPDPAKKMQELIRDAQLQISDGPWYWVGVGILPRSGEVSSVLPGVTADNSYYLTDSRIYEVPGLTGDPKDLELMRKYFESKGWDHGDVTFYDEYSVEAETGDGWVIKYVVQQTGQYYIEVTSGVFWGRGNEILHAIDARTPDDFGSQESVPGVWAPFPKWSDPIVHTPEF